MVMHVCYATPLQFKQGCRMDCHVPVFCRGFQVVLCAGAAQADEGSDSQGTHDSSRAGMRKAQSEPPV